MRVKLIIYMCMLYAGVLQVNAQSFDILKTIPQKDRFDTAFTIFKNHYRQKDSVTAFNALGQISHIAIQLHDKALEIAVYSFKADYYSIKFGDNPHSLFYYDKVLDMARSYGLRYDEGYYTYRRGLYYKIYNRYVLACENYLKAYDIFKSIGFNNVPKVSVFLKDISEFYYSLGDFETAKRFLLEALNNRPAHRDQINMTNTIGLIYRSNNQYGMALSYLNKALNLAKSYKDTVWASIVTGNIGSVYFLEGNYDVALPYIKTDCDESIKYGEDANAAFALLRLARINADRKNFAAAESQLATVADLTKHQPGSYLKQYIDMYGLLAEIGEKTGRPVMAFTYQKKYAATKDSLTKRDNVLAVERIRLKWETDKNQARINQLNAKAKTDAVMRDGLAGILFLLIIITFLLYNRQKIIVKRDQAALLLEKSRADQERDKARLALIDYTDKLRQQNDLVESFKAEMDHMQRQADPIHQSRVAQLDEMVQAHIMTDKAWREFKKLFDKVHAHFFSVINHRFQNLTETDLRLLALIKLRLNNFEMAGMLGITVEGVKKSKQRLRKKAGIPEESSLEEVVAGI